MATKPTVVIGAGGHGKVVLYVLSRLPEFQVLGYVDARDYGTILGFPRLGGDEILPELAKQAGVVAVIGVGKVRAGVSRLAIFEKVSKLGFSLPPVVAPTAIVAPEVTLGDGTVVMDGAILQPGCRVGKAGIINTGAILDHDCILGDDVHVATGARLSGAAEVGAGSFIGVGAVLIQLVKVGAGCTIGGGAAVTRDCLEVGSYVGVPAEKVREMKRTLVAVIAYNEEKNLVTTLRDLRENGPKGIDVVVIDNGSSDRTKAVAIEAGVPVVSHCVNSGSSMGTVLSYFLYAHRNGYDCLCQFDGDGQHVAAELHKIIDPVVAGNADYVIGSRFLQKEGFQSYFFRRLGISLFAFLDSLAVGQKLTDVTSGFRAYSPRVIGFFATRHRHELSDTNQLLLLSHFAGARIREVPVVMRARMHGVSEFRSLAAIVFPLKGVVNILGCLLQRKRIRKTWA